jgi:hypothetical protein
MKKSALLVIVVGLVLVAQAGRARFAQAAGQITSPRDRAAVRGLVPVEGSATDPQFQKYEVHFGPEPNPGDQWTPLEGSPFVVPVVQGRLGLWDTTIVPDGVYSLRLRVVRLDGNYDEYFVRGVLVANRQPTETPTPRPAPTAAGPTNTPAPTPTVLIAVPTVVTPTPRPSETALPTALPSATSEPPELPLGISSIGDAAVKGGGIALALFAGVALVFALKETLAALVRKITGRGREDAGV